MTVTTVKSCYKTTDYSLRVLLLSLLLTFLSSVEGVTYHNVSRTTSADSTATITSYNNLYTNTYAAVYDPFSGADLGPSLLSRCNASFLSAQNSALGTSTVIDTDAEQTITYIDIGPPSNWYYTASPPCCLSCTVFGGGGAVQVFYWPTPAPTPGVSTLVNSANFTFVSPSVYVAFRSLQATDLCGEVGTPLPETTVAFNPDELSTTRAIFYLDSVVQTASTWAPFVYQDLQSSCVDILLDVEYVGSAETAVSWSAYSEISPPQIWTSNAKSTWVDLAILTELDEYYYNPCSPILSVPSRLFSIEPGWKSCSDGIIALYDPPYALTPASGGLQVPQTTIDPGPLSTPAEVGQSPQPETAMATSATSTMRTVFAPVPVPSTAMFPTSQQSANPPKSTQAIVNSGDPPVPTPIVIGSQAISADSSGAIVVGSMTLTAGAPPITISNIPVSLGSAIIVIASSTYAIPAPVPSPSPSPLADPPPVLTLGSDPISANAASAYIIGTQTLLPGGPAVAVSGITYSLPSSSNYIVIDGATSTFQAPNPQSSAQYPPVLTLGSDPITANSASAFVIGTQTLLPGGPAITISGSTYSLPNFTASATAAYIVIDGTTSPLLPPTPVFTPTLDASSNALVLDPTQTLSVGEVLTHGSEVISLATAAGGGADGTVIVVSGTTTETEGLAAWIAGGMGIQSTGVGIPFRGEGVRRSVEGSWWLWLALTTLVFTSGFGW